MGNIVSRVPVEPSGIAALQGPVNTMVDSKAGLKPLWPGCALCERFGQRIRCSTSFSAWAQKTLLSGAVVLGEVARLLIQAPFLGSPFINGYVPCFLNSDMKDLLTPCASSISTSSHNDETMSDPISPRRLAKDYAILHFE